MKTTHKKIPAKTTPTQPKPPPQRAFVDSLLQKNILNKKSLGIDKNSEKQFYAKAYQLYQSGKYREAQNLFVTLTVFNQGEPSYMMGLGACVYMLKEYDQAARIYIKCGLIDPSNPMPYYYASNCYWKKNDAPSALVALCMFIKKAGNKPEFKALKERAILTVKDALKEKSKN